MNVLFKNQSRNPKYFFRSIINHLSAFKNNVKRKTKKRKNGQLLAYIIRSFIDNLQIKFDPLSSSKECYITAPIRSDNALDSNDDLFQVTTKLTGYTELYETPKTIITDVEGVQLKADPREVSSEFINVLEDTVTEVERLITYRNGSITLKGGGKI